MSSLHTMNLDEIGADHTENESKGKAFLCVREDQQWNVLLPLHTFEIRGSLLPTLIQYMYTSIV